MRTTPLSTADLPGVFPVPPLARRLDSRRTLDYSENERLVRHMAEGGITRFLYGGNAFLYHITLAEYEDVRSRGTHFAVVPGHVVADLERVVARYPRFAVVEKTEPQAAGIAAREDPRSP